MDDLLTPVSISYKPFGKFNEDAVVEMQKPPEAISRVSFNAAAATTPEEVLDILRNEPDYDTLSSILRYLGDSNSDFNLSSPSPLAAQMVHTLVSHIIPNYWSVFQEPFHSRNSKGRTQSHPEKEPELNSLLSCLRSVTALNSILFRLKELLQQLKGGKLIIERANFQDSLVVLLDVLTALLDGENAIEMQWNNILNASGGPGKQKALWHELLGLVGGGKILGLAAEAEEAILKAGKKADQIYWIADGKLYSTWLGRNISHWTKHLPIDFEIGWRNCVELLSKSFRLGYTGMSGHQVEYRL